MDIVSIVAIVEMENSFDLDELLNKVPEIEPCLTWAHMRFSSKKRHIAFFKSGKVRISGVKSDEELIKIANDLIIYLQKFGILNSVKQIKVNNYVLVDQFDFNIDLVNLATKLIDYDVTYEPEQFPGLIFKDENDITFLLFSSGKVNITGVKSLKNIEEAFDSFKKLICET